MEKIKLRLYQVTLILSLISLSSTLLIAGNSVNDNARDAGIIFSCIDKIPPTSSQPSCRITS